MRLALLLAIILPTTLLAETAYVTDNLRLGLHQAPDTSDRAFRTLESGQELEIVSRNRNYANVRMPDGVEGYVKAAYLVFEKPAKLIVAETQNENENLKKELEELKAAFASPAATIQSLQQQIAQKDAMLEKNSQQIAALTEENQDFLERYAEFKYSLPYKWVAGAMLVCALGGFLLGMWWIDYQSRKRHGGMRIY
ncbi:MAG: TIGR04211 family SH3 domain-containing protein [Woeseiaceae bacterium]|nr:TIGR04211 family SH3 domain-containing protein [Woeseiaceae bacterium]